MFGFLSGWWKKTVDTVGQPLYDKQREAYIFDQLNQLKSKKRDRDIMVSTQIATYRDRVRTIFIELNIP
jgi:cytochrome c553